VKYIIQFFLGILAELVELVAKFPRCIEFADASEIDLDKLISKEV
jgi:hypothetical protein